MDTIERVASGEIIVEKVLGTTNVADALTKHVDGNDLLQHIQWIHAEVNMGDMKSCPSWQMVWLYLNFTMQSNGTRTTSLDIACENSGAHMYYFRFKTCIALRIAIAANAALTFPPLGAVPHL